MKGKATPGASALSRWSRWYSRYFCSPSWRNTASEDLKSKSALEATPTTRARSRSSFPGIASFLPLAGLLSLR